MPQRFLVPQYIEIEPKMFGPVTIRQFLEMLYAGLIGFLIWRILSTSHQTLALVLIVFHTLIWGLIAFTKINGQNFHYFFLNLVRTLKKPRLRLWGKVIISKLEKEAALVHADTKPTKNLPPMSRLSDLSLLVDTGGAYNVDLTKNPVAGNVEEIKI